MSRLSPVLSVNDLPLPELQAARLDGELFRVDGSFVQIDLPETREFRAIALRQAWPERYIAEQYSAAWVWGATNDAPGIHYFCSSLDARARPYLQIYVHMREVAIDDDEIVDVSGLSLTTPLRTITDIARYAPRFGRAETTIVGALADIGGLSGPDCLRALDRRRNLPNKKRGAARLAEVFAIRASPS